MNLSKEALAKVEEMNKSFDASLEDLKKQLGVSAEPSAEELLKSKKKEADDEGEEKAPVKGAPEGEDDDEGEEGEEGEEEAKPKMKKSLEDIIEDDEDAKMAIDVEPFLKSLVQALDIKISEMNADLRKSLNYLHKKVKRVEDISRAQAQMIMQTGEMQKAMRDTVEKIGETPVPSNSVLMKGGDRFGEDGKKNADIAGMDKAQILQKSLELRLQGKLQPIDVTLIEGRLNKGLPLDARHAQILSDSMK